MKICVVGLGLIGASLAKAIKEYTDHFVYGIDIDSITLSKALNEHTIDKIGSEKDLNDCDLTIISLYPKAVIDFVKTNRLNFKKGSVVIDTCGVKTEICSELPKIAQENGFNFVGAHPMAGKEKPGYDYSEADLFCRAYMILTPINVDEKIVDMLTSFSKELRFKAVTISTPEEHDRIIAYTSQIPHVLACAYISDPDATKHDGFSAGSYKDISRVADINATLWQELFIENKSYLTSHIDLLTQKLQEFKNVIESGNNSKLTDMLKKSKELKQKNG